MTILSFAQRVRKDFAIFEKPLEGKPFIYFDSAATSQKPKVVLDVMHNFYANEYATVHRGAYALSIKATEKYNDVRQKVAQFLHAKQVEEIIFTKSTTDAINLVASSYGHFIEEGDEIIVSEMEHHSNFVPWQMLCQRKKAILKIIPVNDRAELDLAVYQTLLTSRTKLVAVAYVANSTGTVNPIETIIEMAHAKGAYVLLDAAQSVAHFPIDVQALDVDFLAFSAHKAFGPNGVGILYGKYELLEKMPPIQGGGDMVDVVTLEKTTYALPPLRFEAGTPAIAPIIGLGSAIDYMLLLGLENMHFWEQILLHYATEKLSMINGLQIIGTAKEKSAIISFVINKVHPLDLATFLSLEGASVRSGHHCAQPLMQRFQIPGTTRISFAPFNTLEEIDQFMEILQTAISLLT